MYLFPGISTSSVLLLALTVLSTAPRRALAGIAKYEIKNPPLDTDWTRKVGTNPWKEYPRPQLARSNWQNLNGIWKYKAAHSLGDVNALPNDADYEREVMIPSCLESGLSGLQGQNLLYSWLSTSFKIPDNWPTDQRVLMNFGAVDYEATVFINGKKAGFNRGGYYSFTLDVTDFVKRESDNIVTVFVYDPTDAKGSVIPIGKQTLNPSHIFYRPCSGIWQSVWIEAAPQNYVTTLDLNAAMDGLVNITVHSSGAPAPVEVTIKERGSGTVVGSFSGTSNQGIAGKVNNPKLWSPKSPTLYDIVINLDKKDSISSYTGFRTFAKKTVNGVQRPTINGDFYFLFGTLDQGYWPDGLHTPPSLEAMVFDVKYLKGLGMNMIRKHIKVETSLFYQACDELGMVLIQDMPAMLSQPNEEQQREYGRQLELMVNQVKNHPSIFAYTIYNEAWGQLVNVNPKPEFAFTERVRQLAPYSLVNSVSGWTDHGAGDFSDNHHYPSPLCGVSQGGYDSKRIGIQGEFGGLGHNVSIEHLWNDPKAIAGIKETYEMDKDLPTWNKRSHELLTELLGHTQTGACSGSVWTQTVDVEGEVNGLMTYDRRIDRTNRDQWKADIQALYNAAAARGGKA